MSSQSIETNKFQTHTYNPVKEINEEEWSSFQEMLLTTYKLKDVSELPFKKLEHAFEIFNSTEDFSFNDEDERLSNFLVLMACLYTFKKQENVCFISPTYYYAQQAQFMRDRYLKNLSDSSDLSFPCTIPGIDWFEKAVNKCKVLFMHGKDYTEYLPLGWSGRKIIQIFPNEKVPVDPIRRDYCGMHDCTD
ncbi:MAG: hypothetical protein K1060chlam4_00612 [Candidatus Anoxychlamydiales bacterium]|nr:hypothetical protein [Candidatus Anoxychlamydiales bacterium]